MRDVQRIYAFTTSLSQPQPKSSAEVMSFMSRYMDLQAQCSQLSSKGFKTQVFLRNPISTLFRTKCRVIQSFWRVAPVNLSSVAQGVPLEVGFGHSTVHKTFEFQTFFPLIVLRLVCLQIDVDPADLRLDVASMLSAINPSKMVAHSNSSTSSSEQKTATGGASAPDSSKAKKVEGAAPPAGAGGASGELEEMTKLLQVRLYSRLPLITGAQNALLQIHPQSIIIIITNHHPSIHPSIHPQIRHAARFGADLVCMFWRVLVGL